MIWRLYVTSGWTEVWLARLANRLFSEQKWLNETWTLLGTFRLYFSSARTTCFGHLSSDNFITNSLAQLEVMHWTAQSKAKNGPAQKLNQSNRIVNNKWEVVVPPKLVRKTNSCFCICTGRTVYACIQPYFHAECVSNVLTTLKSLILETSRQKRLWISIKIVFDLRFWSVKISNWIFWCYSEPFIGRKSIPKRW